MGTISGRLELVETRPAAILTISDSKLGDVRFQLSFDGQKIWVLSQGLAVDPIPSDEVPKFSYLREIAAKYRAHFFDILCIRLSELSKGELHVWMDRHGFTVGSYDQEALSIPLHDIVDFANKAEVYLKEHPDPCPGQIHREVERCFAEFREICRASLKEAA